MESLGVHQLITQLILNGFCFNVAHFYAEVVDLRSSIQGDPSGLAQGFVDLDLGCSTILIGQ